MPSRQNKLVDRSRVNRFFQSVWFFPAILFLLLLILTAFKINGSSIGIYYPVLYGTNQANPDLLANRPQSIRSDEWLFVTQMTVAQHAAGYPRINHSIDYGRDMSVVGDAPYKDWSAAFKPQNLAFFVLPLEYAFAFKWWLLIFLTVVSCYFLILRFLPGRRLTAAIFSSAVGLSPFLFWWYQTITFAPVFYGFFIILLGMRIINGESVRPLKKYGVIYSQLLYVVLLSYLLISFALILYPPFQIPVALSVVVFLAGYLLDKYGVSKQLFSKESIKRIGIFLISLLVAGSVVLLFVNTRSQAINAIEHTVYPGSRQIDGGGTPVFTIFSSYLQPQLERTSKAMHYYDNQSEASSFLLFIPFLILPGFVLIYKGYKQNQNLNWSLLLVQLLALVFLLHLFVPDLQPLYRLIFLNKVPHPRLLLGLGFVGILQLVLTMKAINQLGRVSKNVRYVTIIYALACLAVVLWDGSYVRTHYPLFIHNVGLLAFFAVLFVSTIYCFLSRRFLVGALIFLILSLGSVFRIHPLYRGLAPIYPSKLSHAIDAVSRPGDTWVSLDDIYFENAAIVANRNSLSGIQLYPDLNFWRQIGGPKNDYIYNRYAHVVFSSDPNLGGELKLVQHDEFKVRFACTPFIERHVQYVLATHRISNTCVKQVGVVSYPALIFYLYRID